MIEFFNVVNQSMWERWKIELTDFRHDWNSQTWEKVGLADFSSQMKLSTMGKNGLTDISPLMKVQAVMKCSARSNFSLRTLAMRWKVAHFLSHSLLSLETNRHETLFLIVVIYTFCCSIFNCSYSRWNPESTSYTHFI